MLSPKINPYFGSFSNNKEIEAIYEICWEEPFTGKWRTRGGSIFRWIEPNIKDRIAVQVLQNLNEAKNRAIMVELIMQEKGEGKFNTNRINYEAD